MRESRVLGRRSRTERASIVSADAVFDRYGVTRIW
jgi:PIN domain nuclease of toxin-antitoxin system